MHSFMYTIKAPVGLHARHAGLLVRETSRCRSSVTIYKGERFADGKRILALMGLGVRQGDLIRVTVSGEDEDEATMRLKSYFFANL